MPKWKSNGSYEPCPEGTHAATCVEVLDIGTQETQYGDKPQVVFGFELAEEDSTGRRYFRRRTHLARQEHHPRLYREHAGPQAHR